MRISDWSSDVCSSDLLARVVGSDAAIVILKGLDPESEAVCAAVGAIPVLNSRLQVARWRAHARSLGRPLPAALTACCGLSRLGARQVVEVGKKGSGGVSPGGRWLITNKSNHIV